MTAARSLCRRRQQPPCAPSPAPAHQHPSRWVPPRGPRLPGLSLPQRQWACARAVVGPPGLCSPGPGFERARRPAAGSTLGSTTFWRAAPPSGRTCTGHSFRTLPSLPSVSVTAVLAPLCITFVFSGCDSGWSRLIATCTHWDSDKGCQRGPGKGVGTRCGDRYAEEDSEGHGVYVCMDDAGGWGESWSLRWETPGLGEEKERAIQQGAVPVPC